MDNLVGQVLVAMPGIGDPRFDRSVILLCAHGDDYAMGLVLNKPMADLTVPQLLTQLGIEQDFESPAALVLDGGPVGSDRGFVLHSDDYFSEGVTLDVAEGLCMTATRDVLQAIAAGGAPNRAALSLGYAGWGPGQLEEELAENAWIITPPSEEIVFGQHHSEKWEKSLELLGIDPARLHGLGGHA